MDYLLKNVRFTLNTFMRSILFTLIISGMIFSWSKAQSPGKAQPPLSDLPQTSDSLQKIKKLQSSPVFHTVGAAPGTQTNLTPVNVKKSAEYRPSRRNQKNVIFDPIKENGEIFKGWERPGVTLVFTGCLNGYMEPCGCAGMDRMKGGLSRRATLLNQLRNNGWNPVVLDLGGQCKGVGPQAQIKFLSTLNMLREMKYDAILLGTSDLTFPAGDLLSEVAPDGDSPYSRFLCANVGIFTMDQRTLPPAKLFLRDGKKIGLIGILGDSQRTMIKNEEIITKPSDEYLKRLVPYLRDKCDILVLVAHASEKESREIAKKYPQIDIIATSAGTPEPPAQIEIIKETGQYYVTVGEKGMNVVVLGVYPGKTVKYQRVPLDSRFSANTRITELMALYQDQLKTLGLSGLGIRPLPNPYEKALGAYVGSERCESCHEQAYLKWQKSRHAKMAWKSLMNSVPPRTSDPECVACHVVGWQIEHKTPFKSGFLSISETPNLKNVGCESCHGPGEYHIKAEMGKDEAYQLRMREAVRLTLQQAEKTQCFTCHDLDNSPEFNFKAYWPEIEHKENP